MISNIIPRTTHFPYTIIQTDFLTPELFHQLQYWCNIHYDNTIHYNMLGRSAINDIRPYPRWVDNLHFGEIILREQQDVTLFLLSWGN